MHIFIIKVSINITNNYVSSGIFSRTLFVWSSTSDAFVCGR